MQPQQSAQLKTSVQLFFKCSNLKDQDTFSKSDPYLCLYQGGTKNLLFRTETMNNNLNPHFSKSFEMDYFFEARQDLSITLYDDDNNGPSGDDALGTVNFQLAQVMGSRNSTREFALPGSEGKVVVVAQETNSSIKNDTMDLAFAGVKLKDMDFMSKSDPYFILSRKLPNGTMQKLHQSEVIDNTLDPVWKPIPTLKVSQLTGVDFNAQNLVFQCFDKDTMSDDSMGSFTFSMQNLLDMGQQLASGDPSKCRWVLHDEKQNQYGTIVLKRAMLTRVPSFVDFLRGGMQINMIVSIDFTGSNLEPRNPRSLHYMNPQQPNQYVRAVMGVGEILMEYDSDKQVPAYGFGAKMPNGEVSHCFNLNFNPQSPFVPGVQGILDAYGHAVASVQLFGPTNFAPTVQVARQAAIDNAQASYTILLILTDGVITDMQHTIDAIVSCDPYPISIIIVGVGEADFTDMNQLDGDGQHLQASNGTRMKRDIVQFVPFSAFNRGAPGALAAEVLKEVPDQVVKWALATGRRPHGW